MTEPAIPEPHDRLPVVHLFNEIVLPSRVIRQTIGIHGERANASLARLPALIDRLCEAWELDATEPFGNLSFNVVLPATQSDAPAVLEVGVPDRELAPEIAAFLRNVDRRGAADRIGMLRERIDLFARELDLDPDRIRDWAVAESVLSAWWVVEDGGDATDAIANAVQTAALHA